MKAPLAFAAYFVCVGALRGPKDDLSTHPKLPATPPKTLLAAAEVEAEKKTIVVAHSSLETEATSEPVGVDLLLLSGVLRKSADGIGELRKTPRGSVFLALQRLIGELEVLRSGSFQIYGTLPPDVARRYREIFPVGLPVKYLTGSTGSKPDDLIGLLLDNADHFDDLERQHRLEAHNFRFWEPSLATYIASDGRQTLQRLIVELKQISDEAEVEAEKWRLKHKNATAGIQDLIATQERGMDGDLDFNGGATKVAELRGVADRLKTIEDRLVAGLELEEKCSRDLREVSDKVGELYLSWPQANVKS